MEALYPRLYIICIFGAEIYKYDGKKGSPDKPGGLSI